MYCQKKKKKKPTTKNMLYLANFILWKKYLQVSG